MMLVCFGYVFDDYLKPGQVRFIVCLDIFWTENASEVFCLNEWGLLVCYVMLVGKAGWVSFRMVDAG